MPPRGRGRGRGRRGRPPTRGRGRARFGESPSPPREESVDREEPTRTEAERSVVRTVPIAPPQVIPPAAPPAAPPVVPPEALAPPPAEPPAAAPAAPAPAVDPTTALILETVQNVVQTVVNSRMTNQTESTREATHLKDFKKYEPRTFYGGKDPTKAQLWLLSIERVFRLMQCPEDQKVQCASFVLKDDAEMWWQSTLEIISPNDEPVTWDQFKKAFWTEFYPEAARLDKQQEFIELRQDGRSVDRYSQEFVRLKRFAPELVNTELKLAQRFVRGLDREYRRTLRAISPTTYADALMAAKAMEDEGPSRSAEPVTVRGQKRRYEDMDTRRRPPARRHPRPDRYHRD